MNGGVILNTSTAIESFSAKTAMLTPRAKMRLPDRLYAAQASPAALELCASRKLPRVKRGGAFSFLISHSLSKSVALSISELLCTEDPKCWMTFQPHPEYQKGLPMML